MKISTTKHAVIQAMVFAALLINTSVASPVSSIVSSSVALPTASIHKTLQKEAAEQKAKKEAKAEKEAEKDDSSATSSVTTSVQQQSTSANSNTATEEPAAVVTTPKPIPAPVPAQYVYSGAQGYSPKSMYFLYTPGSGPMPGVSAVTNSLLAQLGYNSSTLWASGIKIVSYNGLVPKNCAAGSSTAVAGVAIKPVPYATCPNGAEVIPASYKTNGKCTVHYDASRAGWSGNATGNSKAILAHEIAHCLHFIYGEAQGLNNAYTAIRPATNGFGSVGLREILADDFMICRHGVNTAWGNSYYNQYGVGYPTAAECSSLNNLFNNYFPV